MAILLTIFVLSIATLLVCLVYDRVDPYDDIHANIGAASCIAAFLSGLSATLVFIWS